MAELALPSVSPAGLCPACGTELGEGMLACPGCHRLLHADTLKQRAAEAEAARQRGDDSAALAAWRNALPLLPPGSRQFEQVQGQIQELSHRVVSGQSGTASGAREGGKARGWGLAGVGTAVLAALGKGKMLLLGLSKLTTLASMLLSFGVYWHFWGWKFAAGLVLCIYVHEMGHVLTLRKFGIPATAPMFIPGFGALVRLKQNPATPKEDARTGIAGPLYGLGATVVVLALGLAFHWPSFLAIAQVSAVINLFNLTPVGSLDGGRSFRSLSRMQKWFLVAFLGALFAVSREGLLVLVGGAAFFNALATRETEESDRSMCLQFAALAAVLVALATFKVPGT